MKNGINFKVGDWVRNKATGEISQLEWPIAQHFHSQKSELWEPEQGEWCWFRSKAMPKHIQVLAQFKDFSKDTTAGLYTIIFDENDVEEGVVSIHYDECEPFIGQLPTFLK